MDYIAKARALRPLIEQAAQRLDDTAALEAVELHPRWVPGMRCEAGKRVQHEDKLYRIEQTHTAQSDWPPNATPALFTQVAKPGEIPDWVQPTGAQDAYRKGDKVRYGGTIWVSTIDNNVWAPGVYGWEEVSV